MSKRHTRSAAAAIALALATAATAPAADLYWQGGIAELSSNNYLDASTATPNTAPADGDDALYIGADGTATNAAGDLSVSRIIVGHAGASTAGAPGAFAGAGTVDLTAGSVTASSTLGGGVNSGLIVGFANSGALSITNATLTVENSAIIGYLATSTPAITASAAVNAGGTFTINTGGLQLGANGTATVAGAGGSLAVNGGTLNVNGAGSDLVVGVWNKSSFTQTGGTTTVADETFVGRRNADFTTFNLSGGTFNTRNFNVADTSGSGRIQDVTATVTNSTLNITGLLGLGELNAQRTAMTIGQGATVTVGGAVNVAGNGSTSGTPPVTTASSADTTSLTINGNANVAANSFSVGNGSAVRSTLTITDDAVVSTKSHITVGNSVSSGTIATANLSTFNLSGNAKVTIGVAGDPTAAHLFLGRGNTTNTTFNMSGNSELTIDNLYLMGTGPNPTGVVTNHSGGTLTVGQDIRISDTGGSSTYNFLGGKIVTAQGAIVGRQKGTAAFNQTGGTAEFTGRVRIGDAESTTVANWGTGTYTLSGGSVTITAPAGATNPALDIAPAGTGTLRIIGSDAAITVNGDVRVNTTPAADPSPAYVGTLAYRLEAGDTGLTRLNATGIATFAAGASLALDFNGVTPTASAYDLLTAADVVDNGLVFSGPSGWNFKIIPGGNGEILQAYLAALLGDVNSDGLVNAQDISPFVYALVNGATAFANQFPTGSFNNADITLDGLVNAQDISPFVARLIGLGSVPQAELAALTAVPEPTSLAFGLAAPALLTLRRRRRNA